MTAHGRHRLPETTEGVRTRSASTIALMSAVAAAAPVVVLGGSVVLALLIALGTVLAVAVAGFMI